MMRWIAICIALIIGSQAVAQSEEAEKGRVEAWLEEALSSAGRDVRIRGFSGAFASQARFDELSIADDDGVWLTIENATLNWSRSALLSGRVDITEIAAETISIQRPPLPGPALSTDDSQSTRFEVPDLPVSLEIDQVSVDSILIDASVFGETLELSLQGAAQLVDGQMAVNIEALRQIDGADAGRFGILVNFANQTRQLDIDVSLREPKGGIVAGLLNIPDTPALDLTLNGAAPLSEFQAVFSLKTDQSEHVAGEVRYREAAEVTGNAVVLAANLAGDLRPLFASKFHPFFGARSELDLRAARSADGQLQVDRFNLETSVLALQGELELGADGLPNMFNLEGAITSDQPVRLPTTGAPVTVAGLKLIAGFDAAQSEAWTAEVSLSELHHEALFVPLVRLAGAGTIDRSFGKRVTGDVTYAAERLAVSNLAIAQAFDGQQTGRVVLEWSEGADLRFKQVLLNTEAAQFSGTGTLGGFDEGLPISGRVNAKVAAFDRFSGLAGRGLKGAGEVDLTGRYDLLGGGFDGVINGRTVDLSLSEPRFDPLLVGAATIAISGARTPEGTALRNLALTTDHARIQATGDVNPEQGALDLSVVLEDLSLVEPKLVGAGSVKTNFGWQAENGFNLKDLDADIAGAKITGDLAFVPETQKVSGQVRLNSADLSAFAALTNMDLSGAIELNVQGAADFAAKAYEIDAQFSGANVQSGNARLDVLLAGAMEGALVGEWAADSLSLDSLELETPLVSITAGNNGTPDFLTYQAALRDVAPIAPGLSGPFSLTGVAQITAPNGERIEIDATADGPAGLNVEAKGAVIDFGKSLDLAITGAAPLGLANSFIAPNSVQGTLRYDLALRGAAQLSDVSGQFVIDDSRVALPNNGIVFDQLSGTVALEGEQAQVNIRGASTEGGSFSVSGPVSLNTGNTVDLTVALNSFGVTDPELFETSLSGQIRVVGPVAQASISGGIELGATEIVVPSSSAGLGGEIPDVKHIGAPSDVHATLNRAGIKGSGGSASGNAMPLNLVINAPNQIFVRGRGLDAELGGRLVLGGTTSNVAPSGNFDLIRGRFDILGRRFVMSEGLINMRGSLDPFLRFVADTDTAEGVVSVVLEGLASAPELSFVSEAGLPQEEAIAQLLFGRGLESISALQAASLVSAIATLSGRSSGGITNRLREALGLSDFDVTTTETGQQQLRAGAYINENIYSEFSIDSEGNQAIDLNLNITPNLRAKGGTNSAGNTGIGIFFEKDY